MNILSCCLFAAFSTTVGELPPCDYADTEVSTNFPVTVDFHEISRIEFTLVLDASPSNAVEVAIGTDTDGNGNLSVEESVHAFGFDCGTWFSRDAVQDRFDTMPEATPAPGTRTQRTFILKKRRLDESWNLVKVTRRGSAPVCECICADGRRPGLKLLIR